MMASRSDMAPGRKAGEGEAANISQLLVGHTKARLPPFTTDRMIIGIGSVGSSRTGVGGPSIEARNFCAGLTKIKLLCVTLCKTRTASWELRGHIKAYWQRMDAGAFFPNPDQNKSAAAWQCARPPCGSHA